MSTEHEALRLADLLQDEAGVDGYVHDESAAMLRKLVAEREADRAAMREALEALEHMQSGSKRMKDGVWGSIRMPSDSAMNLGAAAITDLRQRLEGTT